MDPHIFAALIAQYGLFCAVALLAAAAIWRLTYDAARRKRLSTATMDGGTPDMAQMKEMYDKPDAVVMQETGLPLVAVWALKDGLMNYGYELTYPPPDGYNAGWHKVP